MSRYKCQRSFTSMFNGSFTSGETISSSKYEDLLYSEQSNFREVESSSGDLITLGLGIATGLAIGSLFDSDDSDSSSRSSTNDFDGFGGGSFGGGGAGDDW